MTTLEKFDTDLTLAVEALKDGFHSVRYARRHWFDAMTRIENATDMTEKDYNEARKRYHEFYNAHLV